MAYTDLFSIQQAAQADPSGQQGQFGKVESGVTVAQPDMQARDPFASVAATSATAPAVMAAIRPTLMERQQQIQPEQPTGGQGNAFMMESQKVMKGGN